MAREAPAEALAGAAPVTHPRCPRLDSRPLFTSSPLQRWPHEATADQYTGWYVGNKSDLGHCRGFLMTPSVDVALRPTRMPRLWKVGRAGPGEHRRVPTAPSPLLSPLLSP